MTDDRAVASGLLIQLPKIGRSMERFDTKQENQIEGNKMKYKTLLVAVGLSCVLLASQARAAEITGSIGMGGGVKLNTTSLTTATEVTTWTSSFVTSTSGDFTGSSGAVTMSPTWTFGLTTGGPQTALWSVNGFTFDLTSDTVDQRASNILDVMGTGTISKAGFTPTPGSWQFTINNSGGHTHTSFSFTATSASLPDGGSAVALLGIALAGIEGLRRKIGARKA